MPINLAHERFIAELLTGHNQVQAYMLAYPNASPSSARTNASRLMKSEYITGRIDAYHIAKREQIISERNGSDVDNFLDVLEQLLTERGILQPITTNVVDASGHGKASEKSLGG